MRILCTFCFAQFDQSEVRFRCIQSPSRCNGWEDDTRYAQKHLLPVEKMGHVFEVDRTASSRKLGAARCDICFAESYTHLCPECHFELSHDIGQVRPLLIAVIGGRGTGKSHYIGSLILTLKVERKNNLIVTLLSDSTQERWMNDFYLPVFERKSVLPGTVPAGKDTRVKIPLTLRLTSKDNAWKRRLNGINDQVVNVSLFDSAGEDTSDFATLSRENQAIVHADGLIFMIDPLQIESVRQRLPQAKVAQTQLDQRSHPENLLARVVKLFEEQGRVRAGEGKIPVPTAFVLSKIDMLESLLKEDEDDLHPAMLNPTTHTNGLDTGEVQSISRDVRGYLGRWLLPSFCDTIENRFKNSCYFGVSALGRQSDTRQTLEILEPLRVEEPLLWLLHKSRFVKGYTSVGGR